MASTDAALWKEATSNEIDSLLSNQLDASAGS